MKTFGTNQLIGIILIGGALIDMYILPRILLKKYKQVPEHTMTPQEKSELERKRKTIKLIITIVTLIPALFGLLFFLGIIPLENN